MGRGHRSRTNSITGEHEQHQRELPPLGAERELGRADVTPAAPLVERDRSSVVLGHVEHEPEAVERSVLLGALHEGAADALPARRGRDA